LGKSEGLVNRKTTTFANKAYDAFPEDEEYKISGSDDNTESTDVDSDSAGSTNDSAYQTISNSKVSSANGSLSKDKRKTTKKIK